MKTIRGKLLNGQVVELSISDGRITSVESIHGNGSELYLLPGFIDLQLNGYLGIDFNNPATTPEEILTAIREVRKTGVTTLCPTIITGSSAHIEGCIANLVKAVETYPEVERAVVGLHIEGPYISPADGPRGAHPLADVRSPDWDEFQRWQKLSGGRIRILTLSPEWPAASEFISRVAASGVIVSIGHTAATPDQITSAVTAGARMSTHLGNGSHAKIDRHPNYIWEQLGNDNLWGCFIVDGHHLPPSVVKCMIRAKSVAHSILVTDAIAAAGLPPGMHKLGNVEVEVLPSRRVNLPGTPYLAGSVLEMNRAIEMTVAFAGISLAEAIQMATLNPARAIGLQDEIGSIAVGMRAELLLAEWDNARLTLHNLPI
jgi:N-acetylglucosamine-6-phosphate deacetylase